MKDGDYPSLYRASDSASVRAQRMYLRCFKWYSAVSIVGAAVAVYGGLSTISAIVAAILFSVGLAISVLISVKKYESIWYKARAVAESVKTATWRYVVRAEPFNNADESDNKSRFLALLSDVLKEHKGLASELVNHTGEQVTAMMEKICRRSLKDRVGFYLENRINEQRVWYSNKARLNKKYGDRWFWVFIGLQALAVLFSLVRIGYPGTTWPIEIFVVAGATAFGWIQVKRYRELTAAYGLTAHEIGLVAMQISEVKTEQQFSDFVGDTENAFSREHTQWIARRDILGH